MDSPRLITEFDILWVSLVDHPPNSECTIKVVNSERGPAHMSMLETNTYRRKEFKVDAVQVTAANMEAVAAWVDGKLTSDDIGQHIKVKVKRPASDRQTRAYVGDWVLVAGTGYKVYNDIAFKKSFDLTSEGTKIVDTSKKPKRTTPGATKKVEGSQSEIVGVVEGDVVVPKRVPKKTAKAS